ncbi:MAG: oligosaccharide flippase family protein [Candidatus Poseidonia sp.]|nr:oligosaccharide flippase family protein [Poseidonia sp.]
MSETAHRPPSSGRDASWLVGADLLAVALAFLGQIVLTHALMEEQYGWMVLAIDLYASLFLVVDLGLPTLLARDGTKAPAMVSRAVWRTYRWQFLAAVPFVLLAVLLRPEGLLNIEAPTTLLVLAGLIALVHVASYAPRSGLRVLGEARLEAMTKVVERGITVVAYAALALQGSSSATAYTGAFLLGAIAGWALALFWMMRIAPPPRSTTTWDDLGASWSSSKALLFSALPFAITLGILPYVVRIEKFMVAASGGATLGAVFHVAQLVWLAGLVVPAAIRSALLPVFGRARDAPSVYRREFNHALDMCFGLLPYGLFGGYLVVHLLAPLAFPVAYLDGTHGASAIDLFTVLLAGWGFTLLATPTYASLMAGHRPWRFTLFILLVLLAAVVLGVALVLNGPAENGAKLYAAAAASSLSAGVLLLLSWWMSGNMGAIRARQDEWALVFLCLGFIVAGLLSQTFWWVLGLPLFLFTKQGWRAVRSTLE